MLGCSIALYLVAGWFVIDMPNFPKEGGWFFNPFAWQILFVIGFILGQRSREGKVFAYNPWIFWGSVAYLVIAFIWTWFELWGYQPHLPIPKTLWDFDKTYVAFPRLFHVLALAYVVMMSPARPMDEAHPVEQSAHRHGAAFAARLLRRLVALDDGRHPAV